MALGNSNWSFPTIAIKAGIKINIYYGDHLPPHIHALYNEHEALVVILTDAVYAEKLPTAQMKTV